MSKPVYILGISCFYHDSAAALLKDGVIVAAAQEERFTRIRHDENFPTHAIAYCLKEAGITVNDLDHVVFYDKPMVKFERIFQTVLARWPVSYVQYIHAFPMWLRKKLFMQSVIAKELKYDGEILFTEHHQSHAASAYYSSPFKEATVVTIDGVGEWETTTIGYGKDNALTLTHAVHFPHSVGLLYSAFTGYLGFKINSAEYKVMGLAPYGDPAVYRDKIWSMIERKEDGSFALKMKYFAYEDRLRMTTGAFHTLMGGAPRNPEKDKLTQREKDIAAALQEVTEELMLGIVRQAYKLHPSENLCMAGGVALNCVGNGRILREGPFKNIFIQPAAGDAGGALGAAQYVWHAGLGNAKGPGMAHAYLGPKWSEAEVETFLRDEAPRLAGGEVKYTIVGSTNIPQEAAKLIDGENVIGLYQGRMEFGPRSLGSRSIIADARRKENWQKVNLKIKFRESFRPFAPTVLEERMEEYFDLHCESPYMLLVADVHPDKREVIPAVTHVDGSARIQTIRRDQNPRYYDILKAFSDRSGCGVIINTSFNVRGEPIVCAPKEAFLCFLHTDMDYLVMEHCILSKADNKHLATPEAREKYLSSFALD